MLHKIKVLNRFTRQVFEENPNYQGFLKTFLCKASHKGGVVYKSAIMLQMGRDKKCHMTFKQPLVIFSISFHHVL